MGQSVARDNARLLAILEQMQENCAHNLALITEAVILEKRRLAAGKKPSAQVLRLFESAASGDSAPSRQKA